MTGSKYFRKTPRQTLEVCNSILDIMNIQHPLAEDERIIRKLQSLRLAGFEAFYNMRTAK